MQPWKAHEPARVKTGASAGQVGEVLKTSDKGMVQVRIQGVVNGEAVDKTQWFKAAQLERNQ